MSFLCCKKSSATKADKSRGEDEIRKLVAEADKHAVLTDIQEMFKMFDDNGNGLITKEEVIATFRKLRIPIVEEDVLYVFMSYDTNGDNQLNYKEFSKMVSDFLQNKEFPVEDMFKYFDADDDGFVTMQEFLTAMKCLGVNLTKEKAKDFLEPYMVPGHEKIDYKNFVKLMKDIML